MNCSTAHRVCETDKLRKSLVKGNNPQLQQSVKQLNGKCQQTLVVITNYIRGCLFKSDCFGNNLAKSWTNVYGAKLSIEIFGISLCESIGLTLWGRSCWLPLPGWTAAAGCGRPLTPPPRDEVSTQQPPRTGNYIWGGNIPWTRGADKFIHSYISGKSNETDTFAENPEVNLLRGQSSPSRDSKTLSCSCDKPLYWTQFNWIHLMDCMVRDYLNYLLEMEPAPASSVSLRVSYRT